MSIPELPHPASCDSCCTLARLYWQNSLDHKDWEDVRGRVSTLFAKSSLSLDAAGREMVTRWTQAGGDFDMSNYGNGALRPFYNGTTKKMNKRNGCILLLHLYCACATCPAAAQNLTPVAVESNTLNPATTSSLSMTACETAPPIPVKPVDVPPTSGPTLAVPRFSRGFGTYFLSDGESCKVGATANMEARVAKLQTGNPRPLRELAFIPQPSMEAALALEGAIHRVLRPMRASSSKEWFSIPPEQMVIIAQVVKASGQLGELLKEREPTKEKEDKGLTQGIGAVRAVETMESALNSCFKRVQEEMAQMEEPLTRKQASVLIDAAKRLLEFLEGDKDDLSG